MAKDPRGSWTIKSPRINEELKNACRMAAARQGMEIAQWVAETLRAEALAVLRPRDEGSAPPSPPARLEDILAGEVVAPIAAVVDSLAARLGAIERRQRLRVRQKPRRR